MAPHWLTIFSWAALGCGFASAAWLAFEQLRRPQRMWIMGIVWPITALYAGPAALWMYYLFGIRDAKDRESEEERKRRRREAERIDDPIEKREAETGKPYRQIIAGAVTHCGAGCTLGDIWSEFMLFYAGFAFAGDTVHDMLQSYFVMDYVLAYLLGIAFQYFTIAPMRGISGSRAFGRR